MDWYKIEAEDLFEILKTTDKGLSNSEVRERLTTYGYNKFAEEEPISKLKIFLHQFMSPLIYILLIAGVITIFLQEYIDSSIIFIVVLINAIVGFIQEFKAEKSVRALKKMVVSKAKVLRDGREIEVNSEELVPGDVVILHSGDRVPADLRLIHSVDLKIDESMLTGESLPVEKNSFPIKDENLTPGDQKNMTFMGTVVVSGRGKGVVVSTGAKTILGKIAYDVKEAGIVKAPIQDKISRLAGSIGMLVVLLAVILFFIGILIGNSVKSMFLTTVAVA
ncbi:MAG: HAD-IC family P-type ATPase, partial [Calditerrivibrio sp.]|nr:HAD-IC family P-type ATPase [Calditerrivibrio sp.]